MFTVMYTDLMPPLESVCPLCQFFFAVTFLMLQFDGVTMSYPEIQLGNPPLAEQIKDRLNVRVRPFSFVQSIDKRFTAVCLCRFQD